MPDKTSSLMAAVSLLGMSLGVGPVAQAQTADEQAGGRRGGTTQVPITVRPSCPTGQGAESGQFKQGSTESAQWKQGSEAAQLKQGADVQAWSWGASNSGSAQMKQAGQLKRPGGLESAQNKHAGAVASVQSKQDQAGAYEFYAPKPTC